MTFLFDDSLPVTVARALSDAGEPVTHVSFENLRGARDRELIASLKARRWHLVTADERSASPVLRRSLADLGIGVFVLTGSPRRTGFEWFETVVRAWPDIRKLASRRRPPYVITIGNGKRLSVRKARRKRSS
jgi:hypothetical protein